MKLRATTNPSICYVLLLTIVLLVLTIVFGGLTAAAIVDDSYNSTEEVERGILFNVTTDTVFKLFTRKNQDSAQIITFKNDTTFKTSNFDSRHPTRFIIHGWRSNSESEVNELIQSAYLERGEFNVIIVDWGKGAKTGMYLMAKSRVQTVGKHVAQFIDWIHTVKNIPTLSITVIGHSLGGHVAGIAGKNVINKLHSIYGLDPAKPRFKNINETERLASTDATYVEVIHTSNLGIENPIGTADFYPNWGLVQPGCFTIGLFQSCPHKRAYEYFAESIRNPKRFMSTPCVSYAEIQNKECTSKGPQRPMGGESAENRMARGIYFIAINHGNSSFAQNYITLISSIVLLCFVNKKMY